MEMEWEQKKPKTKLGWDMIALLLFAALLVSVPVYLVLNEGETDQNPHQRVAQTEVQP